MSCYAKCTTLCNCDNQLKKFVPREKQVGGCGRNTWIVAQGNSNKRVVGRRVPGLPIRDCARGCNNCVHTRAQMSATICDRKDIFWAFVLVQGLGIFGPWVNCPCAPTTLPIHFTIMSRFLSNFFSRMAPQFFGCTIHQVSGRVPVPSWGRGNRDCLLETAQEAVTIACTRMHRWAQ